MSGTLFCGLDAGRKGGVALIGDGLVLTCSLGSSTEAEVAAFLKQYAPHIALAAVERVWGRLGDAPNHAGVLCQSYGFLRGLLTSMEIPFINPTPQKWQGKLGVHGDDKLALRQYMSQRCPTVRWTNGTSAAGCLAVYARLLHQRTSGRDHPNADTAEEGHRTDGNLEVQAPTTEASKAIREWSDGQ